MTNGIVRNSAINPSSLMLKGFAASVNSTMSSEVRTLPFFCPPSSPGRDDEDDFLHRDEDVERVHSPTDNSEDSVEVKVSPISGRNKRKCAEPRRVQDPVFASGPLKKRMCLQARVESSLQQQQQQQPFRPWSVKLELVDSKKSESSGKPKELTENVFPKSESSVNNKLIEPLKNISELKSEPSESKPVIATIIKTEVPNDIASSSSSVESAKPNLLSTSQTPHLFMYPTSIEPNKQLHQQSLYPYFRPPSPIKITTNTDTSPPVQQQPIALLKRQVNFTDNPVIKTEALPSGLRVPIHPSASANLNPSEADRIIRTSVEAFPRLQSTRKEQRNYKNMTRERRIEANARERTRVHTISAAFDTLRRSIPAYSHSQKLSKLSVLRIACSYIMTLSSMVQDDAGSIAECVESVTRTIQREGKLRKKKDDSD